MTTHPSSEPLQPPVVRYSQCPKFRLSRMFWTGLVLLTLGTGPLVTVILLAQFGVTKDPNPNPIGVGILAFLTFWPSIALVIIGLAISFVRHKSALKGNTFPLQGRILLKGNLDKRRNLNWQRDSKEPI